MAVCADCRQEMGEADSCSDPLVTLGGRTYARSREHFREPDGRCHDCGIAHGGLHHMGCDVERCPVCGGQLISCQC
jgi:hypothetical protein